MGLQIPVSTSHLNGKGDKKSPPPTQDGSLPTTDQAAGHRGPSGLHQVAGPTSRSVLSPLSQCSEGKMWGEGGRGVHPFVMHPLSPGSQVCWGIFWERCPTMVCGRAASVAPEFLSMPLVLLCQIWHCLQMASTQPGSRAQSWP